MHHLAAYWNALAHRRNLKLPYWWEPDVPVPQPQAAAVVPAPVTPPFIQNGTTPEKEDS